MRGGAERRSSIDCFGSSVAHLVLQVSRHFSLSLWIIFLSISLHYILGVWCAEQSLVASIWAKTASRIARRIIRSPLASSVRTANATSVGKSFKLATTTTSIQHAPAARSAAIRSVMARKCICKAQRSGIRGADPVRRRTEYCWMEREKLTE